MADPDFRALCVELAAALDEDRRCLFDDRHATHPLADRARAALAQPTPEPPTDEELLVMAAKALGYESIYSCDKVMADGIELVAFAREVLAQPAPEVPTDDQLDIAVIAIQALVMPKGDGDLQLSAVDEGRRILRKAVARWGQRNG